MTGVIAFFVAYILAAVFIGFPTGVIYGMVSGNEPHIAEQEEIVRQAVPVCGTVIGVVCGVVQARRTLRQEMIGT